MTSHSTRIVMKYMMANDEIHSTQERERRDILEACSGCVSGEVDGIVDKIKASRRPTTMGNMPVVTAPVVEVE
jgi:hypothetical protein